MARSYKMISPALHDVLESAARAALGNDFRITNAAPLAGDDINTALALSGPAGKLFVKLRGANDLAMFEAEAAGLRALTACTAIRTPQVIASGTADGQAFLLLEWLDIGSLRNEHAAARAGEALAELHRITQTQYGWPEDNFIGSTPQRNALMDGWAPFFAEYRLRPQFELAAQRGFGTTLKPHAERILNQTPALFLEYRPQPSLLHGDLWSGNLGALPDGTPVLFDPACYFGDREADLAMTELFGGLPSAFYAAYRRSWPLHEDYERRKPFYNLYHILNHLNLFGRGYLAQAERMAASILR